MSTNTEDSRMGFNGAFCSDKGTIGITSTTIQGKGTNGVECLGKAGDGGDAIGNKWGGNGNPVSAGSSVGACSKIRIGGTPRVPPPTAA